MLEVVVVVEGKAQAVEVIASLARTLEMFWQTMFCITVKSREARRLAKNMGDANTK